MLLLSADCATCLALQLPSRGEGREGSLPNPVACLTHSHPKLLGKVPQGEHIKGKGLRSLCVRETRGGGRACTTEEKHD